MNKQARSRKFTAKQSARLGAYLAAGLGASTAATPVAEAAIFNINIGPSGFNIGGVNAGLSDGQNRHVSNFPFSGAGGVKLENHNSVLSPYVYPYTFFPIIGLDGTGGLRFAINDGGEAKPRNFALNASIDNSADFSGYSEYTLFRYDRDVSPDFGPGSYMGFETATGNYGWLEVTWNSKLSQFRILSGAYEDVPGVAINAGATAPIPEPGTWVAMAVFAGGAAFAGWRRRRDEARQEAA